MNKIYGIDPFAVKGDISGNYIDFSLSEKINGLTNAWKKRRLRHNLKVQLCNKSAYKDHSFYMNVPFEALPTAYKVLLLAEAVHPIACVDFSKFSYKHVKPHFLLTKRWFYPPQNLFFVGQDGFILEVKKPEKNDYTPISFLSKKDGLYDQFMMEYQNRQPDSVFSSTRDKYILWNESCRSPGGSPDLSRKCYIHFKRLLLFSQTNAKKTPRKESIKIFDLGGEIVIYFGIKFKLKRPAAYNVRKHFGYFGKELESGSYGIVFKGRVSYKDFSQEMPFPVFDIRPFEKHRLNHLVSEGQYLEGYREFRFKKNLFSEPFGLLHLLDRQVFESAGESLRAKTFAHVQKLISDISSKSEFSVYSERLNAVSCAVRMSLQRIMIEEHYASADSTSNAAEAAKARNALVSALLTELIRPNGRFLSGSDRLQIANDLQWISLTTPVEFEFIDRVNGKECGESENPEGFGVRSFEELVMLKYMDEVKERINRIASIIENSNSHD